MITILLVDDYPAIRQLLREVLQRHTDIEVIGEASTGEEAVVQTRILKPTVVLIDIQLPSMTGIQATALIKGQSPSTTIIGLTAGASQASKMAMQEAGAATVVSKEESLTGLYPAIIEESMLDKISSHLPQSS